MPAARIRKAYGLDPGTGRGGFMREVSRVCLRSNMGCWGSRILPYALLTST